MITLLYTLKRVVWKCTSVLQPVFFPGITTLKLFLVSLQNFGFLYSVVRRITQPKTKAH